MEIPSNPKTEDYTYKQGQYSPRKRKDTTPKVNPQLAVELVFQELKRVETYTKRIEDATAKKVEIDRGSLESAENRLKSVLADFERQGNRMKNGSYVDKNFFKQKTAYAIHRGDWSSDVCSSDLSAAHSGRTNLWLTSGEKKIGRASCRERV